ncbi:MAG: dTDP-glucose 4,6-dehydratase [Woeseia sp.]|jgi:dTDP-glucose 4,6-dehydratase|nr:dTDP-glucose 4,6-dehydratase [Woeseia sp.]MBT6210206.1 dTDP-glucose 4,6-dehydratase [Woeseia sp.]
MRKLLVTGGAGFIGANFVHYWKEKYPDDEIIVLDLLTYAGNMANLQGLERESDYRFVHADIVDQDAMTSLFVEHRIDTVVHFAAESHVDRSIHEPDAFIQTNVIGTHNLLRAAKQVWLDIDNAPSSHRFHHVSTDEVYGTLGRDDPAFCETTPYAPNSPYAASKAASDHLVRAYHHTYGLEVTTSNCSNNYGPYQFPEKLIPLMIVNALTGQSLPVYGDGSNIRDWLYVEDHCRGIDLVMSKGTIGETYNIGGNNERANIDIVKDICARIDAVFEKHPEHAEAYPDAPAANGTPTESLITFVKDRLGHDWRYAIDAERSESELGYAPIESFDTGLDRTISWMLENESWWRSVTDGSYRDWLETNYD